MIVLTGATGQLGRAVVQTLLQSMPASQLAVSVRDPAKAGDLMALGVDVRQGDFARPETLDLAFAGADILFLVSSNAAATGGDPLVQHRAAIDAARAAGVRHIVYTSQMAASPTSAFPPALHHAATEAMLAESGLGWTALRHGFYAASAMLLLGNALSTGLLEAPEDGRIAWTTHADLAAADAAILADIHAGNGARYQGPTPVLTGSMAWDLSELAAIAADLSGTTIVRTTISDAEMEARLAARGVPAGGIGMVMGIHRASRAGEFAGTDPLLERLIGRKAIPVRAVIAAALAKTA